MGVAERDAIARTLRTYAEYRAQLWLDDDGHTVEIPAIDVGNPVAGQAELMIRLAAHEPLTRPATNADWIDPLINLASLGATGAGIPFRFAGPIAEAIDGADIAATSTNVAERTFAMVEEVAVRGSRADPNWAASYETGVQKLYGDVPLLANARFRSQSMAEKESGVADSTTVVSEPRHRGGRKVRRRVDRIPEES